MNEVPVKRHRLILEGYGCSDVIVQDVHDFLIELTVALDMRILVPPMIVQVPIVKPAPGMETEDIGISGQLIWMESGCQVHQWTKHGFVAVDIFSCKAFAQAKAEDVFDRFFQPITLRSCVPVVQPYTAGLDMH
jgi:S-adenosylmethionine/arginine decarboxylase-like enzyme